MEVVVLQVRGVPERALDQRFRVRLAVFLQQVLLQAAAIDADADGNPRIARGLAISASAQGYAAAVVQLGAKPSRVYLRHILPNVLSPIMVAATLGIASAIITESALSFLGLGFPPDFPTWGRLLFDAIPQMQTYPMRVVLPGLLISLTVLTVNYIGDGLRDAMDPRIRGR